MPARARPLPPDERRAALIAATVPLVRRQGLDVTTREIAVAAGVAEGTIFSVFPDKDSLLREAVGAAFDPEPVLERLRRIDRSMGLEQRLVAAVEVLQQRLTSVVSLVTALRQHEPPSQHRARHSEGATLVVEALADVFAPDADRLRVPPAECARMLRVLVFAGTHPRITDDRPLAPQEIADLLLHGVADAHTTPTPSPDRRPTRS